MSHAARPSIFGFQATLVEGTLRHGGRQWTGCAERSAVGQPGPAHGLT